MQPIVLSLGGHDVELKLPPNCERLAMSKPTVIRDPAVEIAAALERTLWGPNLAMVIKEKVGANPEAKAVVVISDNTRPVPYRGEKGILWPIVARLLEHGISPSRILVLVATGTHRALTEEELRQMLDPRVFQAGVRVKNHDCDAQENLSYLGRTKRGSEIYINREYMEADLKILTGLVESHFMVGFSGGRKSVCPGLVGRQSTYVFHGAPLLASPQARDLLLEGNPCHDEALEVALKAGVDYILNVTLDDSFELTGVFGGDLQQAHQKAVERVQEYAAIPLQGAYDIVITHAGFVGINHYQAAKAGVVALPALKKGGRLILLAYTTDHDQVGSSGYRAVLHLLKIIGPEKLQSLLLSPDWTFIPDQWQVQMWARVLEKTPLGNLIYFCPALAPEDYRILPCVDGNVYLPPGRRYSGDPANLAQVAEAAVLEEVNRIAKAGKRAASLAFLADGPYGIPIIQEQGPSRGNVAAAERS